MRQALTILVGIALAMGGGLCHAATESNTVAFDAAFAVRAIAALAESYVGGLVESMHTLAATEELRAGNWDRMVNLLATFEESALTYDSWFLLPDGAYYKVETGLQSANLSDRAYFAAVMGGEATLGDLVHSRSTGRKSMVLTVPVRDDDRIIGALGVTLYLEELGALLANAVRLPVTIGFYATGQDGRVSLCPSNPEMLLEAGSTVPINRAVGGIQISAPLGWTFVLGTFEE